MITIAIDGPAGAGKGTISKHIANTFNFNYLDTGLLYRQCAFEVRQNNLDINQKDTIIDVGRNINVDDAISNQQSLRNEEIADIASKIAVIHELREILTNKMRLFVKNTKSPYKGVILDGRDIGTTVLPEADIKIFVTASSEKRQERRFLEIGLPYTTKTPPNMQTMIERDSRDSKRLQSPLQMAADASILDTTNLSIDEACQAAVEIINKFIQPNNTKFV
jgi:cytidylate kinase